MDMLLALLLLASGACTLDRPLADEIARREQLDQLRVVAYRAAKSATTEEARAAIWAAQENVDADNVRWLDALIARGWPSRCAVGENGQRTLFLILQHAD